ncbi:hypothetical protein A6V36_20715 [Paraburkholderia ginsengiterrae]|uniref:Uncharacterized protein n=1 Tax=Paraburkholderia ginsengiterrae TaxID=1462993 RepID=A0A1A9NE79_9BURK|nr:hypothetical protein [Paraburkholderia ginsengiterrae]OAJ62793.1 hypothetical protein A6V36_20715 [Paraburkholderia ginsengiterrae]OAJ64454.1 hypothetical protein A6V37_19740 [Paraburkholderia ginsengiterrae]
MAVVNAYLPQPSQLMFETEEGRKVADACIEFGGWHHRDKTLTPIQLSALLTMPGNPGLAWAMDSLAAAAEAGILDGDTFIGQLFASKEDVRACRLILRDTGADKWLNDRHFTALKKLGCAELDAVNYASIASFFDPAE